ncbi:hypothetical protein VF14_27425 [Nostoc linckia z18]|uniref:Uncharacterized protein n=1 Tax=Nostoc linckia z7 TaxID=1628745 RepID=A0ABX4KH98_NOSLI|nr:hypothetical protein VF02_33665 [Nostoc linckia z1]PHJ74657.1 hypothetical protein VF06_34390 [Nostoc linckia z4]PHJ91842.1 hypothetical protein VF04_29095 [Nostoc linckia z7]PHK06845.1 hypothetical protein VF09_24625 [Nostoc linckia z9]PHK16702.1 hypothetical protein VF11_24065 [Nostoc linckia z14]PHK20768.1 hypothetical protein VF10_19410 [Nostoc linckia z13]PHK30562.1 hypothetical protein VF14_27425 [Nostoc linckia z18]PHK38823.1 hypothetical protein VF12_16620 [Nostoc linckia z15]PHK
MLVKAISQQLQYYYESHIAAMSVIPRITAILSAMVVCVRKVELLVVEFPGTVQKSVILPPVQ